MNCKYCGNKLTDDVTYCKNCGFEKEELNESPEKGFLYYSAITLTLVSTILFFVILFYTISFLIYFATNHSGADGWYLIIFFFLVWIPFIPSILCCISNIFARKCKKKSLTFPKIINFLRKANWLQLPIFILTLIIGVGGKIYHWDSRIDRKVNELYNSNYKVLGIYSEGNESAELYDVVVLDIDKYDVPIVAYFDWEHKKFDDNYDEMELAKKLKYDRYIKSVFDDSTISLMEIHNDKYYKSINLSILLTVNYLNDEIILKDKLKQIINNYKDKYFDYSFNLDVYFTNNIKDELIYDYYAYISYKHDCNIDLENIKETSIFKNINIYIYEDSNIDEKINNSFE